LAWEFAEVKIDPWGTTMPADNFMTTVPVFVAQNAKVEVLRLAQGKPLSAPIAGHKKDIVITNRIATDANGLTRVFIYGWQQLPNGNPIQNISAAHDMNYTEYSHGTRLVNQQMSVNGVVRNVRDVLRDPALFRLISHENGPMRITEYGGTETPTLELVLGTTANAPYTPLLTTPYILNIEDVVYLGIRITGTTTWLNRTDHTLTSSNESVATIAADGTVTAVGLGTTVIKAVRISDNVEGQITLTVVDEPTPPRHEFHYHGSLDATWLNAGNIKRTIHRDGKLYVLSGVPSGTAVSTEMPAINVYDAVTLEHIRTMNKTGISGGRHIISDIAFTEDGKLLACNLEIIITTGNNESAHNDNRFKVYIWDNDNAEPRMFYELWRNTLGGATHPSGLAEPHEVMLGNWGNGFLVRGMLGTTMAVSGTSDDAIIYTPTFSANLDGTLVAAGTFRMVAHQVKEGVLTHTSYKLFTAGTAENAGGTEFNTTNGNFGGVGFQMTMSPLGNDRIIITHNNAANLPVAVPAEYHWDWNEGRRGAFKHIASFAEVRGYNLFRTNGVSFFNHDGLNYMAAPIADTGRVNAGVVLFDITDGLNKAVKISEELAGTHSGTTAAPYMMAFGASENKGIALSVLAENQGLAKFATYQPLREVDNHKFHYHGSQDATWLNEDNIKRAILHENKLYVLTKAPNPKIFIANPATLEIIKEMDLTGVSLGLNGATLNDIAITDDGKLLACNLNLVDFTPTNPDNVFKVYIWDNDNAAPALFFEISTGGAGQAGNWTNGRLGDAIAVSGTSDDLIIYASAASNAAPNSVRIVAFTKRGSNPVTFTRRHFVAPDATNGSLTAWGNFHFTMSPLSSDRIIVTSSNINPLEIRFDWAAANASTTLTTTAFADARGETARIFAANYFEYDGLSYMAAAVADAGRVNASIVLYDITDGFDSALKVSEQLFGTLSGTTAAPYMKAFGVVEGEDIVLFAMAENQGFAKFATYQLSVGINNPTQRAEVRVYPNPVQDILHIEGDFEIKSIRLIDLTGRTIMNSSANQRSFDMSNVQAGNYILFVNDIPVKVIKR
jgi:hypothetical protein